MRPTFIIAIFLLAFGLFFNMLTPTGLGLFDVDPLPVTSPVDSELATQLTEAGADAETNPIGGVSTSGNIMEVVFGGILNVLFVVPVCAKIGIPEAISWALNAILILVYVFDMALWLRGLSQ